MRFAKWVFRLAGVYGLIVMTPFYFLEPQISAASAQPIAHLEYYYGFVGAALAFQAMFLVISTDPARYRPAMIPSVLEKLLFAAPVLVLCLRGRVAAGVAPFAAIDLLLGVLFAASWLRTRPTA
ncbi:hypothetical protein [Phenylobacterium sp.]|uniref:hypothetical protein n=1 Tax=Phenylobacterium sp. TaxID=1871053 RepID=UPI0035AFDFDF